MLSSHPLHPPLSPWEGFISFVDAPLLSYIGVVCAFMRDIKFDFTISPILDYFFSLEKIGCIMVSSRSQMKRFSPGSREMIYDRIYGMIYEYLIKNMASYPRMGRLSDLEYLVKWYLSSKWVLLASLKDVYNILWLLWIFVHYKFC